MPGTEPTLHVSAPDRNGTVLVEVEGDLDDATAPRWHGLLRGAAGRGAGGLAIDLRGCEELCAACLLAVMEVADALERSSRPGVALAVLPGSALERQLASTADVNRALTYPSLTEALRSFGDDRGGRFTADSHGYPAPRSRFLADRDRVSG